MKKKANRLPRFHVLKTEPTTERVMKLPSWAQQYIFDLEVRADPAGDIRELAALRADRDTLIRKIAEQKKEIRSLQRRLKKRG